MDSWTIISYLTLVSDLLGACPRSPTICHRKLFKVSVRYHRQLYVIMVLIICTVDCGLISLQHGARLSCKLIIVDLETP